MRILFFALVACSCSVSNSDREEIWIQKGKALVAAKLEDPESAEFRNVFFNRGAAANNLPMTCGEVNSRNASGLPTGYRKFVSAGSPDRTHFEDDVDGDFGDVWDLFCGSPTVSREAKKRLNIQGDADAQFNLGRMYDTGRGVLQDDAEAVRWYRLAAEQGDVDAQFNLGAMYGTGRGVLQDDAEAARWYRLAAEQGDADAQLNLGVMHDTGLGVFQDDAEAVRWYRLAAEQGDADAQFILGRMYGTGRGVLQDDAEAVRWYRLAAEQGQAEAQFNLLRLGRSQVKQQ